MFNIITEMCRACRNDPNKIQPGVDVSHLRCSLKPMHDSVARSVTGVRVPRMNFSLFFQESLGLVQKSILSLKLTTTTTTTLTTAMKKSRLK